MTIKAAKHSGWALRLAVLAALAMAIGFGSAPVRAEQAATQGRTVLLELYTSQGCASCPPADEMLHDLVSREDVIALALHVDYWDYIGWSDTFGSPAHTERQQAYARRHGHSTIYTPQVILNGQEMIEGFRTDDVMEAIARHHARPAEVDLSLVRTSNGGLEIRAVPMADVQPLAMTSRRSATAGLSANAVIGTLSMSSPAAETAAETTGNAAAPQAALADAVPPPALVPVVESGPFVVHLIRYIPQAQVDILHGENAGRTGEYANIVSSWIPIANWDMRRPFQMTVALEGDAPVVVVVQEVRQGEVLAAARLR